MTTLTEKMDPKVNKMVQALLASIAPVIKEGGIKGLNDGEIGAALYGFSLYMLNKVIEGIALERVEGLGKLTHENIDKMMADTLKDRKEKENAN